MSRLIRFSAAAAPALLLLYGLLRVVDGLDGDRHNGPAWDLGHLAFFAGIVLFAVLAVALRRTDRPALLLDLTVVATVFGAGCFLWVILGDLFESFQQSAPLPDALKLVGPALFEVGLLVLLVRQVVLRRLPIWSPVAVLVGFAAIGVNLDLLPIGAALVLVGLLPLWLPARVRKGSLTRTDAE
jgi:hypothetical protein